MDQEQGQYPGIHGANKTVQHVMLAILPHLTLAQRAIIYAQLRRQHREDADHEPEDMGISAHDDAVGLWVMEAVLATLEPGA